MKKSDGAGETLFRRGFAREDVQARGDDRYCKNAQGNGAPEFLLHVVVIKVRAEERTEADDVRLPRKLRVTNPAFEERKRDCENDPPNSNPWRMQSFLEDPHHHAGAGPGVCHLRCAEVPAIYNSDTLRQPIQAGDN